MSRLSRFWRLTKQEKKLLSEATILLFLSNIFVKAIAFRRIEHFLRNRWNGRTGECSESEEQIQSIKRSVSRAAILLPFKSLCLSRSIAEFVMLRRRGISAVMVAGARFAGHSTLEAHAWVETGLRKNDATSDEPDFTTVIKIG